MKPDLELEFRLSVVEAKLDAIQRAFSRNWSGEMLERCLKNTLNKLEPLRPAPPKEA